MVKKKESKKVAEQDEITAQDVAATLKDKSLSNNDLETAATNNNEGQTDSVIVKKKIILISSMNNSLVKITTKSLENIGFPNDVISITDCKESDDTMAIADCLAKDEFDDVIHIIKAGCVCLKDSCYLLSVLKSVAGNINNIMPYAIAKIELDYLLSKSSCEADYYKLLSSKKHVDTSSISDNIIAVFGAKTTKENAEKYAKTSFFLDVTNFPQSLF